MGRRKKQSIEDEISYILFIIGLISYMSGHFQIFLGLVFIFGSLYLLALRSHDNHYKALKLSNVDLMSGHHFEHYLGRLLRSRGYNVTVTKGSGDLGIDIIAQSGNQKIAIQAKRHSQRVSRRAISDAVAGAKYYGCNQIMVITNSYFSSDAITLARVNNCVLVDRDTLATWINDYNRS